MAKRLFVGNLSWGMAESDLLQAFAPYGATGVVLPRDERNRSKGFAFVDVPDEHFEAAVSSMNGANLDGREIVVNEARPMEERSPRADAGPTNKLYVGGISETLSQDALQAAFAEAGTVVEAAIITNRDTGERRGFAFVTMGSVEEAEAAKQMWDGKALDGQNLRVTSAQPKN